MLAAAVSSGARLRRGIATADEVLAWPAAYRLDCTGRTGVVARAHGARQDEPGHRTVALVGLWRHDDWPLDNPSHTLLESYLDGWAWSVPVDASTRALAVMVDPQTTALAKGEGAMAIYLAEVAKTTHLARLFHEAPRWNRARWAGMRRCIRRNGRPAIHGCSWGMPRRSSTRSRRRG